MTAQCQAGRKREEEGEDEDRLVGRDREGKRAEIESRSKTREGRKERRE